MRRIEIINHEDHRGHRNVAVRLVSRDTDAPEALHEIEPGRSHVFYVEPGQAIVVCEPGDIQKAVEPEDVDVVEHVIEKEPEIVSETTVNPDPNPEQVEEPDPEGGPSAVALPPATEPQGSGEAGA